MNFHLRVEKKLSSHILHEISDLKTKSKSCSSSTHVAIWQRHSDTVGVPYSNRVVVTLRAAQRQAGNSPECRNWEYEGQHSNNPLRRQANIVVASIQP